MTISNVLIHSARSARDAERIGCDAGWLGETAHDPFLPIALAAEHTSSLGLGISSVVALARSPMNTAYLADDLARFSDGRFILGLSSQVAAHINRRFSMPYGRPVARMREYVAALREIWSCWRDEREPDFQGDFYTHTLMTPSFSPGPTNVPPPPVFLAAVGSRMAALAGEIADGLLVHLFNTPRYLREVTLPALSEGVERAGRRRSDVQVVTPAFVVTGVSERAFLSCRNTVRRQIAFYGSTPAYEPVLALHGLSDLHWELYEMSLVGEWDEMTELIDDQILDMFAVEGDPHSIAPMLWARYGGLADRIALSPQEDTDAPWDRIVADLRALTEKDTGAPAGAEAAAGDRAQTSGV